MDKNIFKLLVAEDNEEDLQVCKEAVDEHKEKHQCDIKLTECKSVDEALKKLDNTYDGAIIDLKFKLNKEILTLKGKTLTLKGEILTSEGQSPPGNDIIRHIEESRIRIPIAVVTATPVDAELGTEQIGVFKKGEIQYGEVLDRFWELYEAGFTRVMGGRGIIEDILDKVYRKSLLPQKDEWVSYGKTCSERSEKALLRYTLNHLLQLLDDDTESWFPAEVYLKLLKKEKEGVLRVQNGQIVKENLSSLKFVILTPVCDLVLRKDGKVKTDHVLLVEIECTNKVVNNKNKEKLYSNNHDLFHHRLPKSNQFEGGFLNFRKLNVSNLTLLKKDYEFTDWLISPPIMKNLTERFSSYYARQGQPEIDEDITQKQNEGT